jgi:2-keto-4-pentenoate hydratase
VADELDPHERAADRLEVALRKGIPTPPVRDILGSTDLAAAYAVQGLLTSRRVRAGARIVGRKIGLTAPSVQKQLGVDQPDFGVLFDDMSRADRAPISLDSLIQPKIEAEIAFVLLKDLNGELNLDRVRDAVDHAVAALEIVDSRVSDWDITIVDTIADNGSSGLYVLSPHRRSLHSFEPRDVVMSMSMDGEVVSSGTGSACLGDPLESLLWLARTAQAFGDFLRAGEVILSGALGPMVNISKEATIRAEISGLGSVSTQFVNEGSA